MKLKALLLSAALFSALLLTGCYDAKEIDETAYIVALGIDNASEGAFSYTFQFSAPLAISGASGEDSASPDTNTQEPQGNSTVTNLTINAPDFYVARNLTNNFMSKNVDMSHLKLIVFSSEVSAEDLESHSQLLLREREIRPHTSIAVAADTAAHFLENVNPELESNTSKYYELMSLRSNNVYAPTKRLHDFVDDLTVRGCDTVLPIAVSGRDVSEFTSDSSVAGWVGTNRSSVDTDISTLCGMAIFSGGKLIGTMDGDSAMIFNILNKNIENCTVTIENKYHPSRTVSFRIVIPEKASFKVDPGTKKITVSQSLQAEFLGSVLPDGYKSFDELYSHLRNMITNRTADFLHDISAEKSADILALRQKARCRFLTFQDWNSFSWDEFYRQAVFSVNIHLA